MGTKTIIGWILLILGLLITFGTHIAMVSMLIMDATLMFEWTHATLNLVAGVLILIGAILK